MDFINCDIKGLKIIEPTVFGDVRGYFFESFNQSEFEKSIGKKVSFCQDNQSLSNTGVVRGLHFQNPPHAQGKLVRVMQGSVLDVALDIRKESPTFGQFHVILLSAENKKQFWIPEGFAHGFSTLEDNTIFQYKCTNYYHPSSESSLLWCDNQLNIDWLVKDAIISAKDQSGVKWEDFITPF
ncbi:dTDP-4-dehydrorhamnose 3,5-epimerase [Crocinitomicaceae bacterium]|jgi:dTDP-4-dehydrorhamnose 3,5-epimerase|nr:dTDP-4-dehydrorhamnose 3,5-epimerase [Crocinitomicaceae bacterium]